MKEYPLKGVKVLDISVIPDERGFFAEGFRSDWKDFLESDTLQQANISYSYPGMVRAWHRHERGQVDYFLVLKGSMKICAYEESTGKMAEVIGSGKRLQLIRIPGHYLHGTKTVSSEPSLTTYFVSNLYDYKNPDEVRVGWNASTLVPTEINGKKDDPRVGKPWDWFAPPHK
jgi:dTDP-4-dehydrorhamnose 3,5-epimerase